MSTPINLLKIKLLEIVDATQISANAINDHGQAVGQFADKKGITHGFLYQEGSFCQIDCPDTTGINILGINNLGQMVGLITTLTGTSGFVYDRGTFSPPLNYPGSANLTVANAINDRGEIVGIFQSAVPGEHSFLLKAGVFQQLTYPNSKETAAQGINENGQVVGNFPDANGTHGFVYLENVGVFTPPLDCPGASGTVLRGINNEGQIVGGCIGKTGHESPFLYMAASLHPILIPHAITTSINGMNSRGQIVGNLQDQTGSHSFIATLPT